MVYCYADCESVQRKRKCIECRYLFYTSEYEAPPDRYRKLEYEKHRKIYLKKLERIANDGQINARMPEAAGRTSEREVRANGKDECAGNS